MKSLEKRIKIWTDLYASDFFLFPNSRGTERKIKSISLETNKRVFPCQARNCSNRTYTRATTARQKAVVRAIYGFIRTAFIIFSDGRRTFPCRLP